MKTKTLTALCAVLALSAPAAFAQPGHRDDHHDNGGDHRDNGGDHHGGPGGGGFHQHPEWHKGAAIGHDDWNRGQPVDYHSHHLRRPPRGYQWRQVDGNYVLAAAATGLIASIIANGN
jgi:Ni/Co efflux regulator RcnB